MSFLAQGTALDTGKPPFEIREYTNNLVTLSKITTIPFAGNSRTQMVMAYESGANNSLVAMVTNARDPGLFRSVRRWNGTSWDIVSTPANLAPPVSFFPGTDHLFIAADNTYYYFYFDTGTSNTKPLFTSSSTDRGLTWSTPTQISAVARDFRANGAALIAVQDKTNASGYKLAYPGGGASGSSNTIHSYPDNALIFDGSPGIVYNYDYNCDYLGVFHTAGVTSAGTLYFDNVAIYTDASVATDYRIDPGIGGGDNLDGRSPIVGLDFSKTDSNIAYIIYVKKTVSLPRAAIALIEYNFTTNTIISNTVVASCQGSGLGGIAFNPSEASSIQSAKLDVFADNSLGLFVSTYEGSPNFDNSFHVLKRTTGGVWSYTSGPLYCNVGAIRTFYATFATRYGDVITPTTSDKAIFGYGFAAGGVLVSTTNLVTNTGVVGNDVTGVGTVRYALAAAAYGTDKAIFGYGGTGGNVSMTNLVTNTGVVGNDVAGVGTARSDLAAAAYGTDKAIFGYGGGTGGNVSMTNLVTNTGVVGNDVAGVGTARSGLAAAAYGTDKAIFGYGYVASHVSMTNLVTNTGVVGNDVTGVGTARTALAAAAYGTDKAIFGYGGGTGGNVSMTNLVTNTGVVGNDVTGVGTPRFALAAAAYGTDKAIFGYGSVGSGVSMTNLVTNTGVVGNDVAGVGTARSGPAAAAYG